MKIGVFDSGIGGKSVAQAVEKALPAAEVLFMHDSPEHFPYATKHPDEIYSFIVPIFQHLVDVGCDAVIIACNTVSTTLAPQLRETFRVPLIALEPMVKPAAALTKSGVICVCATPTTLASQRYAWLKGTYAKGATVLEPDCADWSYLIERNQMTEGRIRREIEPALARGADVIVLGCTHYHWIEQEIRHIVAGKAEVLQPETAVIAQLKRVLSLA
ncbi:MAG TPA: aspartate/glutamate racemase family protein [Candidatus Saccharimonadales bacterium]